MSDLQEFDLPSGAKLKVQVAPFADAKALYQAVLEEVKGVQIGASMDITSVFKDLACVAFSSKKIEAALEICLKRCLYNDLKIDKTTFDPPEKRQDFVDVCFFCMKENLTPFTNGLFALFSQFTVSKEKGRE